MLAALTGQVAVVKTLLAAGADVAAMNCSGWFALHLAAQHGDVPTVRALLAAGGDFNAVADGKTPLHVAARCGSATATVHSLLALRMRS